MSSTVKFLSIILLVSIFASQNIFAQAENEKQPKTGKPLPKKDTPTTAAIVLYYPFFVRAFVHSVGYTIAIAVSSFFAKGIGGCSSRGIFFR